MRGRRSSRSAAVVLAGCVGLAVMAPGLALAEPVPATDTECANSYGTGSVLSTTSDTGCTDPTTSTSTGGSTGAGSTGTGAGTGSDVGTTGSDTGTTGSDTGTTGSDTGTRGSDVGTTGSETGTTGGTPAAGTGTTGGTSTAGTPSTPEQRSAAALADPSSAADEITEGPATQQALAGGIDELTAALALPIEVPDGFIPGGGNIPLDLPFDIPTEVPEGGFTNPQEACAFLVGGLNAAPQQLEALGTAFSDFCGALPTSFTGFDPTSLIEDLVGLLQGLIDAFPTPGTIPNEAPHYVPAHYWGYWHHQYDVDCPELTYDEANAILDWDRSDPFRLDRDNDGEACENNRRWDRDDDVEYVVYDSYPVGGVATGDGTTDSGASGVEVALAAGALSGLGVTGLALVRRFARQG